MLEIIGYVLTAMCLIGTVLNCKKIVACFIIWMFANTGWAIYDIYTEQTYRAILDIVQFITAIWGYSEWSKKE